MNANAQFSLFLGRNLDDLFDMEESYFTDPERSIDLREYFFSCLPHVDKNIFSKKRYDRRHEDHNGMPTNYSSKQAKLRRFIAWTHGVTNENQDQIKIYKPVELDAFKQRFEANVPNKEMYFDLVEFIKESGENYRRATID